MLVGVNDPTCYNCGRRNPGLWGFAPALRGLGNDLGFVNIVTGGTIVMYVLSVVMSREGNNIGLEPNIVANQILGASGAIPVFGRGWWWTVLTAGWLHGGIFHIFFNVLWIRQLGPEIASLYGAGRMVIIYTFAGVTGFALSSVLGLFSLPFFGAPLTVGASASIFGSSRAVHYGRRTRIRREAGLQWASYLGMLRVSRASSTRRTLGDRRRVCFSMVLDPLRRNASITSCALVCLVLTLAAVVYTLISALPFLR